MKVTVVKGPRFEETKEAGIKMLAVMLYKKRPPQN